MTGPTPFNQKGQFENNEIRDKITKPFLTALGVDRLGQYPLPRTRDLTSVPGWNSRILSVLRGQGYEGGIWFYKGAKLCLYWPVWHGAFPEARWIIVRRDPDEIASSCLRTPFMRAFSDKEGWLGWVREHEERFEDMQEEGLDVFEVWPGRSIDGDLEQFKSMIEWVKLEWNDLAVKKFITPSLWHTNE